MTTPNENSNERNGGIFGLLTLGAAAASGAEQSAAESSETEATAEDDDLSASGDTFFSAFAGKIMKHTAGLADNITRAA